MGRPHPPTTPETTEYKIDGPSLEDLLRIPGISYGGSFRVENPKFAKKEEEKGGKK
jgi:hypothetical protein